MKVMTASFLVVITRTTVTMIMVRRDPGALVRYLASPIVIALDAAEPLADNLNL
jgi:hypothetical protein